MPSAQDSAPQVFVLPASRFAALVSPTLARSALELPPRGSSFIDQSRPAALFNAFAGTRSLFQGFTSVPNARMLNFTYGSSRSIVRASSVLTMSMRIIDG